MADTSYAIEADDGSAGLGERILYALEVGLVNVLLVAERFT